MTTYNFTANAIDFGNWDADSLAEAKEKFASDAGYTSWAAMVEDAGNEIEIYVDGLRVE